MSINRLSFPVLGAILLAASTAGRAEDRFAGFPPIGKDNPGQKSTQVIASDPVEGLLRPKWTRAMADLGSGVNLFRYKGDIYFVHGAGDGHRGAAPELKGKRFVYVSQDEGRTWNPAPQPEGATFSEYTRAVGDKLFDYWYEAGWTWAQTSEDGIPWTPKQQVYQSPYWLYEVNYDPVSEQFWCAAQSMAVGKNADDTWILRDVHLLRSKDGLDWQHVSTLPIADINISEADLRFEPDRTMAVIVRRKWSGDYCTLAVAKPPYTEWEISSLPEVAEGHSFFEAGGQIFMGSRAYFRDEIPEVTANKSLRYVSADGVAYTVIHRFTEDRKLVAWAVVDSMGDCSYPRIVETPTEILVAYYSEHEDNVCKPYLAAFDKQAFLAPMTDGGPDAAGFPTLGELYPGQPSAEVITSDAVTGGVGMRPKWARAMADLGSEVNLYRFGSDLYFDLGPGQTLTESEGTAARYVSKDEGQTWTRAALPADHRQARYNLSLSDKLLRYDLDGAQTWVQASTNGIEWSQPEKAYEGPYWLYGAVYDAKSQRYWCASNSVPGQGGGEPALRLLNSKDGIHWDLVSDIVHFPGSGEAALHFEEDRTAVIVFTSGTNSSHFAAWAPPPYTSWKWYLTERSEIAEEHSFFSSGGRTFLATRAVYTGDNPQVQSNPPDSRGRRSYLAIYRMMKDRQLQPWAVLDSMGDCGGARLVETPTEVLVAYYSQHQDGVVKPYLAAFDKTRLLRKR